MNDAVRRSAHRTPNPVSIARSRVLKCSKISEGESEETCRRNEKRILLKSFHCEYEDVGGKIPYINCEFHLVDLETNEIHLSYLPPLLNCAWDGEMSALDRVVYILGGLRCDVVDDSHFKLLKSNSPQSEEKFYLGASRFDLGQQSQGGVWGPAPASTKHSESILCATLFGKIYALGPGDFTPEVFDPAVGHWKTLCAAPPELDASILSDYLLPDPSNNCILVHFTSPEPSLYAFTPPTDDDDTHSGGGTWKCLHSDFRDWSHVAAVVDGLLFLYSPGFTSCLRVFDIAHRRWLKVRWIKRFGNGINIKEERIDFDALLPLSDKILCLAVWSPMDDPDIMPEAKVIFAKFTAQRIGKIVYLIPLSTHTYVLEETNKVHQFLPV